MKKKLAWLAFIVLALLLSAFATYISISCRGQKIEKIPLVEKPEVVYLAEGDVGEGRFFLFSLVSFPKSTPYDPDHLYLKVCIRSIENDRFASCSGYKFGDLQLGKWITLQPHWEERSYGVAYFAFHNDKSAMDGEIQVSEDSLVPVID